MLILSFDVGIKNLAYCLAECSNDAYVIKSWNVINLCNEQQCDSCTELAKYCFDNKYYCNKHGKQVKHMVLPKSKIDSSKSKKCVIAACNKNTIPIDEKTTKAVIVETANQYMKASNYMDFIDKMRADKYSLIDIGRSINTYFNVFIQDHPAIDCVIIENQITPIANRMKSIQAMITQYFITKDVKTIEYISASNKLSAFTTQPTTYKERKSMAITITKDLIKDQHEWVAFFNTHKKKDDLSDCLLQALWYLKKH